MIKRRSFVLFFFALLASTWAGAATQSLQQVQSAAEKFVHSELPRQGVKHFVTAGALDARLQLAECSAPLQTFAQNTSGSAGRMTVGVRCPAANTWTVYVPVTIEVEATVLVLRRALSRRAPVRPGDVETQVRRLPHSSAGYIEDATRLAGHRLKRSLPAGTVLTVDVLAPDLLVRRGQQVTLIAASGPIEIRAQGQALGDGAERDRVRVQNVTSLKVVEGVVVSDSIVRVTP